MIKLYREVGHTKTDMKVHLVWLPKYRRRVLTGQVGEAVRELLRRISSELEMHIISGKVAPDHVHLFMSYPVSLHIPDAMQKLKGKSAYKLFQMFPELRKRFWGGHFWARGYFAASSGSITDEMIQRYIENQEGEDLHGPIEMTA
jgi:putative transposase